MVMANSMAMQWKVKQKKVLVRAGNISCHGPLSDWCHPILFTGYREDRISKLSRQVAVVFGLRWCKRWRS
jgi:hypothetical protein